MVLTKEGGFANLLAMPYGNGLTVAARNRGAAPIENVSVSASVDPASDAKAAEYRAKLPPAELGKFLANKGTGLLEKQEYSQAEGVLRECLNIRQEALAEGDWLIFNTMSLLGESLSGQGKFAEAEPLLIDANAGLTDAAGTIPAVVRETRLRKSIERLATLYGSWDAADPDEAHAEKAAQYRAKLPASPESKDPGHPGAPEEPDDTRAAQP